jgi:hypothetical protein
MLDNSLISKVDPTKMTQKSADPKGNARRLLEISQKFLDTILHSLPFCPWYNIDKF